MNEESTQRGTAPTPNGLSAAFGAAAASSLRRPIRRRSREEDERTPLPIDEPNVAGTTSPELDNDDAASSNYSDVEAPEPIAGPTGVAEVSMPDNQRPASPSSQGLSRVQIRDRRFVDGLLLAAAKGSPSGGDLITFVRERSSGAFHLAPGVVYRELHRLEKERLITVIRDRGARRYMLTEVGERVLARRRREWDTIDRGLSNLFKCVDDKPDGDSGLPY